MAEKQDDAAGDRIYACADCGALRTKDEGGRRDVHGVSRREAESAMTTLSAMMRQFMILNVRERIGERDHPAIQWAHELCRMGESVADEVPWCSSIINLSAALTNHRRSRSAAARSWLNPQLGALVVNQSLKATTLRRLRGNENVVLIFKRGAGRGQLGAEVLDAPGHVAVFADFDDARLHEVKVIGGNQSNAITETWMPIETLIGILVVEAEALPSLS